MTVRLRRLLAVVPLAAIGALWFWWLVLPWPVLVRWRDPGSTEFMDMRRAAAAAAEQAYEIAHDPVPLDRISPLLQRAVVLAEDGDFYRHDGIDWDALAEEFRYRGDEEFSWLDPGDLRALFGSLVFYLGNRDEVRGRSTITQQLAKNLYFGPQRSPIRKLEEFIVARRLEFFLPKDRILELYLNFAEWGPGIFGSEAAARHYFGRSAADLSRDQAAALAATLPHPLTSNPKRRPGEMNYRKRLILERMARAGPIRAPEPD